jgi:hypothetical protein
MEKGTPICEAAGYLGMSAETLERVYGHHHPSSFEGARSAITRQKPTVIRELNRNKRSQSA